MEPTWRLIMSKYIINSQILANMLSSSFLRGHFTWKYTPTRIRQTRKTSRPSLPGLTKYIKPQFAGIASKTDQLTLMKF